MALRGADGALRHSLHRSAFELLYLPLSRQIRDRYKTVIDSLGQRGGQALGSLAILGAGFVGLQSEQLAIAVGALAVGWVVLALTLRRSYLDLFRANLRAGTVETRAEVPQLDLGSLESLMQSLNSERDEEVLATLDVLADYGRTRLIPALLLYHPSRAVVLRALELFGDGERTDFMSVARRLLEREDDEIRAAAMRALSGVMSEDELHRELQGGHPPAVRASVLAALVAERAAVKLADIDRGQPVAYEVLEAPFFHGKGAYLVGRLVLPAGAVVPLVLGSGAGAAAGPWMQARHGWPAVCLLGAGIAALALLWWAAWRVVASNASAGGRTGRVDCR